MTYKASVRHASTHKAAVNIEATILYHEVAKFDKIIALAGLKYRDLLQSLDLEANRKQIFKAGEGAGKSGSFFFFCKDNRFIVKTLRGNEKTVLLGMLDGMITYFEENPDSLIAKILGLFTIKNDRFAPVDVILMESTAKDFTPGSNKLFFDMKGSTESRLSKLNKEQNLKVASEFACRGVLKDLNLLAI